MNDRLSGLEAERSVTIGYRARLPEIEVKVLARGRSYEPGRWGLVWDGRRNDGGEAGVGVYFARVKTIDGTWVRPIVRIR